MRGSPWKFQRYGQCGHGDLGAVPRHRLQGRRDRADPLLLRRRVRPRARHVPAQFRLAVSRAAESRLVGRLRSRVGESEPAGVCRDVGWRHEVGPGRLQRRLPAGRLSGHGLPQRRISRAEPGIAERHHVEGAEKFARPDRGTQPAAPRRPSGRLGTGGAHRLLRAGVSHAKLRAGSGRSREGDRRDQEAVRHRRAPHRRFRPQVPPGAPSGRARRALHPTLSPAPTSARTGTTRTTTSRPRTPRCARRPTSRSPRC